MCCCLKGGKTKRPCNICDEEHKHMHKLKPQEEPNARSILQLRPYFEECRAFETIKKELASMRDLKQITKARYETLLKDAACSIFTYWAMLPLFTPMNSRWPASTHNYK